MAQDFPSIYRRARPFLAFYEGITEWPTEENETEYHWRLRDEIRGLSKRWIEVNNKMIEEIKKVKRKDNPTFEEFQKEAKQIEAITDRYPDFPKLEEEVDLFRNYLGYVHFGSKYFTIDERDIVDMSSSDLRSISSKVDCYYLKFPENHFDFFPKSYKLKHKLFNYTHDVFSDGAFIEVERRSDYLGIRVLLTFIDKSRLDQRFQLDSDHTFPTFEFSVDFADDFVLNKAEFGFNSLFSSRSVTNAISYKELHEVLAKEAERSSPNIFNPEEAIIFSNMNKAASYILNFEMNNNKI